MAPRAEIGFLVGDAVFDETRRYSPETKNLEMENAVSTLTNELYGREHWPKTLTWDEAQSELSTQMSMPSSIARIALHDDVQHTHQGQNQHADSQQGEAIQHSEMQDENLDGEMQDSETAAANSKQGLYAWVLPSKSNLTSVTYPAKQPAIVKYSANEPHSIKSDPVFITVSAKYPRNGVTNPEICAQRGGAYI
ncbi:hypothetical protein DTO027I6_10073 [Penicillium roqueforti]|nr:hypothetical protein CBS147337_10185 [Penicillium roqueforti]KAI3182982.1 hypothetical protein DTO027I6_10073 [Penicillium roqueforti]